MTRQKGVSLAELMVATVILVSCVLLLMGMFSAGAVRTRQARACALASFLAREKMESVLTEDEVTDSEGSCDILVNGKKVFQTGKGKSFGELALLYDAPRAATVVATSDVHSWAVDRVTFKQVMIGTTMRKREMYEGFLRGVPIFSTLTREVRRGVVARTGHQ